MRARRHIQDLKSTSCGRDKLDSALQYMQTKRNLMNKGKRTLVQKAQGNKPPVFKWKRERKN